jgi:molecular chaperone DnaK (HSP70)
MSVVGLDFGYDTCYISVARAGGIESLANDYSMRDSPSMVGFSGKSRVMCVGAKNQLLTNLKRTFFGFKSLLGRKFDDPVVQDELSRLPFPVKKGPNGEPVVEIDYLGKKQSFTPVQLTAMLFTKLKETADTALQTKVKDVVVSVPVYYTDRERRCILDAAAIAGLNVLKLMNDTTATALAYGIYKQDLPAPEEKPRNVIFVDCGHQGIQAAGCSFNKGKLVMQSCAFDRTCGGRSYNEVLAKKFAEDFKVKYKVDALTNNKALLKLISESEKLKKMMSANTNKIPLNIECFMEDKDVSGSVTRAEFEELIEPHIRVLEKVLRDVLAGSKWKQEDIYSVEIVGGSTRVPIIKTVIEKIFGKVPNTTLNADESVSRGCALQCAILSPTFKVREFSVTDIQPFPIKLSWQTEGDTGDMVVFPQFHAVPFSKMLTFYRRDNFCVEGEYDDSAPIPDLHIGNFEIGEVKPKEDGSNQKVKVKVRVNLNGVFTVSSASLIEKHEVEEEVPMEVDPKEEGADKKKEEGKEDEKENGDEKEKEKATAPEEPMDAQGQEATSPPKKTEKRMKTVSKTIDLPITPRVAGSLSRDKLEVAYALEQSYVAQDRNESERINSKNSVEEYIYDIRSKIHDELEEYITEDDRSQFSRQLEDAENWLYEDGEEVDKPIYVSKLTDLRAKGEPIKKRRMEFEARPAEIEALGRTLQQAGKIVDMYKGGDEKYVHINKDDMDKVYKLMVEKRDWLDKNSALLAGLAKTADPPVFAQVIRNEKISFETIAKPILNKAKPKPKVEPPPMDDKKDEKAAPAAEGKEGEQAAAKEGQQPEDPKVNPVPDVNGGAGAAPEPNMDLD